MISPAGLYRAPHSVPVSTTANNYGRTTEVLVTAVAQADPTASDSVIVVPTPIQASHFPAPVPLGASGGNAEDLSTVGNSIYCCSGTIGSLVSRGGRFYILSNTHVLARSDLAAVGEAIVQPGLIDNNCRAVGTVMAANLSQFGGEVRSGRRLGLRPRGDHGPALARRLSCGGGRGLAERSGRSAG